MRSIDAKRGPGTTFGALVLLVGLVAFGAVRSAPALADPGSGYRPHNGTVRTKSLAVQPGAAKKVISTTITLPDTETVSLNGWVSMKAGKGAANVSAQLEIDGTAAAPSVSETVGGHASVTIPFANAAIGVDSGHHTFAVLLNGDAPVTVTGAYLSALGLPFPGDGASFLPNTNVTVPQPTSVLKSGWTDAATVTFGTANVTNVNGDGYAGIIGPEVGTATVSLRFLLNGQVMGPAEWLTVHAGEHVVAPASISGNLNGSGTQKLTLQASSTVAGVTVDSASLTAIGLPSTGAGAFNDLPNLAGALNAYTADQNVTTSAVQTVLDTSVTGAATTDNASGGWITVQNPTSTSATVTIQTQANGEIEGPPVTQTVLPHSQAIIPGGAQCSEDPTGVQTHALLLTSSVAGLQVQSGVERMIALLSPATP